MKQMSIVNSALKLALVGLVTLQVACSSSSSDPSTAISGSVVAAPVAGASVLMKDAAGNTLAGPVTTASDGSYSISVSGAIPDTIILESSGGTYSDEASGADTDAGMLMAYVDGSSMSAGSEVHATPASTIVYEMVMTHSMTLSAAQAAFESAFGFAADTATAPADATAPAADATEEELLAGLRAAVFSQLTADLGLTPAEQFDLLIALAADLADGELNGKNTSGDISITTTVMMPIDIQNRFTIALLNFHSSGLMGDVHGNDMTGLDSSQIGILPFAKVALTDSYKVEYVPGMMDPMQGKSVFKLNISDKTGAAISEKVALTLLMSMEDRQHSTPDLNCKESVTAGEYDCTVYYVMPSVMATGDTMGYWQIEVEVGTGTVESAFFYPQVMMAMGDTTRVLLKGQVGSDTIMMMGEEVSRPYNLFRESLAGDTDDHTFEVFIAPMETMMSFPALEINLDLNSGALVVTSVTVEFSTKETPSVDTASDWTTAVDNGNGFWSATSIAGLTNGTEGKIHVKLSVNGELKTTNGTAHAIVDGIDNGYTSFKVTPGGM